MKRALSRFFVCLLSGILCCSMMPLVSFGFEKKDVTESASSAIVDFEINLQEQFVQDAAQDSEVVGDACEVQVEDDVSSSSNAGTLLLEEYSIHSDGAQYAQHANSGSLSLSIEYDRSSIRCGTHIEFKVVAAGGRGKYIYRLNDWSLKGEGYWPYIVDPASSKYQDSDTFSLTFYTSGTYNLSFGAMESTECGEGHYAFSSVLDGRISFTINDPNYPSKEKIADQIATECKSKNFSSDFEKALWLHDWLIDNCEYNVKYCNPEGAFVRGEGNCESYHGAFMMLLERVGIACGRITGNGHVWTAAKLDGSWCQIDVTWDDHPQLSGYPDLNHLYFGLDDRLMGFAHPDHNAPVVGYESNSLENHYYVKSGEIRKYSNQYINQIQANLDKGVMNFSIPVVENYWDASYADIIQNIVAYDLSQKEFVASERKYKANVSYANKTLNFDFVSQGSSGKLNPGWNLGSDGNWRYGNSNGSPYKGWLRLGSYWYYLDPVTGIMQTGWLRLGQHAYYLEDSGVMCTGGKWIDGKWYYFDGANGGLMHKGWLDYYGVRYYLHATDGYMLNSGLEQIDGEKYYFDPSGAIATWWRSVGNDFYLFGNDGRMLKGWQNPSGYWYYLDSVTGIMQTGWLRLGQHAYYLEDSGVMCTGGKWIDGKWYYFDGANGGLMHKGWLDYYDTWYYLHPTEGHMQTGWITLGENYYYMGNSGAMSTGWQWIDGNCYYFDAQCGGLMQRSKWIGQYWVDENGVWDPNMKMMPIMGFADITIQKYVDAFHNNRGIYPQSYQQSDAPDVYSFFRILIEEANAEGVRADVVAAQSMLETGWLKFGGIVQANQYNFAGIGALDGNEAGNAATYESVREGLRAQVQHLKAYASTEPLNNSQVDPRFHLVKRGCAPYVEWLGKQENPYGLGWATGKGYGSKIVNIIQRNY